MLWTHRWEIQPRRDRVRLFHLTMFILHQRCFHAEEDTSFTVFEWCTMLMGMNAFTCWLNTDQTYGFFFDEIGKHTNRV